MFEDQYNTGLGDAVEFNNSCFQAYDPRFCRWVHRGELPGREVENLWLIQEMIDRKSDVYIGRPIQEINPIFQRITNLMLFSCLTSHLDKENTYTNWTYLEGFSDHFSSESVHKEVIFPFPYDRFLRKFNIEQSEIEGLLEYLLEEGLTDSKFFIHLLALTNFFTINNSRIKGFLRESLKNDSTQLRYLPEDIRDWGPITHNHSAYHCSRFGTTDFPEGLRENPVIKIGEIGYIQRDHSYLKFLIVRKPTLLKSGQILWPYMAKDNPGIDTNLAVYMVHYATNQICLYPLEPRFHEYTYSVFKTFADIIDGKIGVDEYLEEYLKCTGQ